MLGHIFENLLEDNKEKGAYYTPKPIVHYMCQESIIEYLNTTLGSDDKLRSGIEHLIKNQETGEINHFYDEILMALKEVKVCDPAIGSGAFPMGILQGIYQTVETIYYASPDSVGAIWQLQEDKWNTAKVKKQIIQHSIYGVDIEQGAVDIARLRFWLSLIVDEEEPSPLPNLEYKIRTGNSLLSTVSFNGEDEPIEIDWEIEDSSGNLWGQDEIEKKQEILNEIHAKQDRFFNSDAIDKEALEQDIRSLKIDLLMNQLQLMINIEGVEEKPQGRERRYNDRLKTYLQTQEWKNTINKLEQLKQQPNKPFNHFEWKLDFPEVLNPFIAGDSSGFDIIIANPPYVKEYTDKSAFDGFRNSPYYQGKMDIWYGFACKSIDMLCEQGVQCFIAQNNWVTSSGASIMRNKVIKDTKILQLVDFGDYMIFENASIQTMVMLFKKSEKADNYQFDLRRVKRSNATFEDVLSILNKDEKKDFNYLIPTINCDLLEGQYLTFSNVEITKILSLIHNKSNFKFGRKEVGQGIVTPQDFVNTKHLKKINGEFEVGDGIFVLSDDEKKKIRWNSNEINKIKPYYTSKELNKYYGNPENNYWIIYTDSSFGENYSGSKKSPPAELSKYPNITQHLDQFKNIITSAWKPYGLHRNREQSLFKGEKVISLRKCSDGPRFTYTDFPCYVSQTFYVIKTSRVDLKYLTGLLNSHLVEFWLKHKGKMQGDNYQVDKGPIMDIPVFVPKNDPGIGEIVDIIRRKKESDINADVFSYEKEIDLLVFKLYSLSYSETMTILEDLASYELDKEEFESVEVEEKMNLVQ
jgi:hypothetical protein